MKNEDKTLKIGIVGVGSLGTTFSIILASKGYDVEITKKNTNALVIDNCVNLEMIGEFGDRTYLVPCVQNNNFTTKKDIIFMCTQSYSTVGALNDVKKYLKPNGIVITIQNVLNIDDILKVVPKERYVALVVDWTATRRSENAVTVLRGGDMHIGVFDDHAKVFLPVVKDLFSCVSRTIIHEDMMAFIASRFVLSCTISSILAITGHKLKDTLENKLSHNLFVGVISEMLEVFEADGIKVPPYLDTFDYYQFTAKGMKGAGYRKKMFNRLKKQNGNMSSSILRALENKKKTELDSMCARIVELGREKNIATPFNEAVATFLQAVDDGNETIFMENLTRPEFTNLKINWRR